MRGDQAQRLAGLHDVGAVRCHRRRALRDLRRRRWLPGGLVTQYAEDVRGRDAVAPDGDVVAAERERGIDEALPFDRVGGDALAGVMDRQAEVAERSALVTLSRNSGVRPSGGTGCPAAAYFS